jgi:hypothetical protein
MDIYARKMAYHASKRLGFARIRLDQAPIAGKCL